jgi:hypothetical protein
MTTDLTETQAEIITYWDLVSDAVDDSIRAYFRPLHSEQIQREADKVATLLQDPQLSDEARRLLQAWWDGATDVLAARD